VCIVVLAGILLYFFYPSGLCNQDKYDMFYFLKALRTNDVKLCQKVLWTADRERCLAAVEKNDKWCPVFPNGEKDHWCQALGKQDITFCDEDNVCKALVEKNVDYCNAIDTQADVVAENLTPTDLASLKKGCRAYANLNAEFFISSEQMRSC